MALFVEKFGGTSVGGVERIEAVADHLLKQYKQGKDLVVVLSAMSGETNRLLGLAKSLCDNPSAREMDVLLSTGEQVTIALLSIALQNRGVSAQSFTADQVQIRTDNIHGKARIQNIETEKLVACVSQRVIPIIAGFQGVDHQHNITTLGRGGSDTSAVALAAALKAKECRIYTDVDGVYSTDPRVVKKAKKLSFITSEEMLELASLGAKVLQTRSVEFARKYRVPLRVLSSFKEGEGTLITYKDEANTMETPMISGIAFQKDEAKLTIRGIPDNPGIAFQVLGPISEAHINVDIIIQNASTKGCTDLTFTVSRADYEQAHAILQKLVKKLNAKDVKGDNQIAKVSIVGVGMRSYTGVAELMFKTLAENDINILMISTSEIKISVVVEEHLMERAVRVLHSAFGLDSAD